MKDIGNRLKLIREALGISQKTFAQQIDISPSFISQIEHGNKDNPGVSVFLKIADFYKVSLDYLLKGAGDMFLPTDKKEKDDYREYIEEIETEDDLMWLMERSRFFKDSIMGYAGKFKYEHDDIIRKSTDRYYKIHIIEEDSNDPTKIPS